MDYCMNHDDDDDGTADDDEMKQVPGGLSNQKAMSR